MKKSVLASSMRSEDMSASFSPPWHTPFPTQVGRDVSQAVYELKWIRMLWLWYSLVTTTESTTRLGNQDCSFVFLSLLHHHPIGHTSGSLLAFFKISNLVSSPVLPKRSHVSHIHNFKFSSSNIQRKKQVEFNILFNQT